MKSVFRSNEAYSMYVVYFEVMQRVTNSKGEHKSLQKILNSIVFGKFSERLIMDMHFKRVILLCVFINFTILLCIVYFNVYVLN